jgi:ABC-type polysaccharide/polyol phosphate export permease
MMKRTYNFVVGVVLIFAALVFLFAPGFLDVDAFIPFMFSLVSFILGIGFFFMGHAEK